MSLEKALASVQSGKEPCELMSLTVEADVDSKLADLGEERERTEKGRREREREREQPAATAAASRRGRAGLSLKCSDSFYTACIIVN